VTTGTADGVGAPRRVLLVETSRDGTVGGSHQALYDLARLLDAQRFVPVVLFYETNPFVAALRALGIRVLTWDAECTREHGSHARWFTPRRFLGLGDAIRRRVKVLHDERIDLIHVNNSPSLSYFDWLPAARLAGVPCVTHLRGELLPMVSRPRRWAHFRFDRYITISEYVTGILEREGFPLDRIRQIEDGIDCDVLRSRVTRTRDEVRSELGVAPGRLFVVMAGHLRPWKGQDVVLRALAQLTSCERSRCSVVFAGADDPLSPGYRRDLTQLVADHGLADSVTFLGDRRDLPDLMNAADLVLHASTSPEPFGLTVLEGLALGRLVIASAFGGPRQIVTAESGWTFDPDDPIQLTRLLQRVLRDPELATAIAPAARNRADQFTARRTARRVQDVYSELLN
jgi:glycosyltransferase involved in cell wall biosynthesis